MEHETNVADLSHDEIREIKMQLEEWRELYDDVYITEFEEGSTFIWRCLTHKEFKKAMDYFEDPYDRAEYVCRACVLDPVGVDYEDDMLAGIPETLTDNILQVSGFSGDTTEMESLMNQYDAEMNTFSNQISCVIVEAFPQLSIEEVESWSLKKMLWYHSRAQWILKTLRGIELTRDDQSIGGNVAPDGTVVKGDPRDFPELM